MAIASRNWLLNAVFARLGESQGFYEEHEVERSIIAALAELGYLTGFRRTSARLPLSPDRIIYLLPAPVRFPITVEVLGARVQRSSLRSLLLFSRKFTGDAYSTLSWCPIGWRMISVFPKIAKDGVEAVVEGIAEAPVAIDPPHELPDELVNVAVELAWHRLTMREGGAIFANASRSMEEVSRRMREMLPWRDAKLRRYRSLASVSSDS